jgi:hypothetical protein
MNSSKTRSYVAEYSITGTDWQKKEIKLKPDLELGWSATTADGLETKEDLRVGFIFAAGSSLQVTSGVWVAGKYLATVNQQNMLETTSAIYQLTQVRLEAGENANIYYNRSMNDEIELCERYYEKCGNIEGLVSIANTSGSITFRPLVTGTTNDFYLLPNQLINKTPKILNPVFIYLFFYIPPKFYPPCLYLFEFCQ